MTPPITDLIPHRGRSLLIDGVVEWDSEHVVCSTHLRPDFPYMRDGRVRAIVGLELMAQTVGAYVGLAPGAGPVRVGYVVSVRRMSFGVPGFVAGDTLSITARPTWREGRVARFDAHIGPEDSPQASAVLTVYEPTDDELASGVGT